MCFSFLPKYKTTSKFLLGGYLQGLSQPNISHTGWTCTRRDMGVGVFTCVDVAVFASILGGNYGSHVRSAQGGKAAELSVKGGDFARVAHHLETRDGAAQITPQWRPLSASSDSKQSPVHPRKAPSLVWHTHTNTSQDWRGSLTIKRRSSFKL